MTSPLAFLLAFILVAPPPDDALAAARQAIERADAAADAGDLDAARGAVAEALRALAGQPDAFDVLAMLETVAYRAGDVGELRVRRDALDRLTNVLQERLPAADPDLQRTRLNLANTLYQLGDLAGASALYERNLGVPFTPTAEPSDRRRAQLGLAATRSALGDASGARELQDEVFAAWSGTLPDDHPELQALQHNLAATRYQLGDLAGARPLFEQVLASHLRTLPGEHVEVQRVRLNLAAVLKAMADLDGAASLEDQALAALARTVPDDHPELQRARSQHGDTLHRLGDLHGAQVLQEQVLAIGLRRLPDDHPQMVRALWRLADTRSQLGDVRGARQLEERLVAALERTVADDDPMLQRVRLNLALSLAAFGDLDQARALQEGVVATLAAALPDDDDDLQEARSQLAVTLAELGELAAAEALHRRILEALENRLPGDDPAVARARGNLAGTLYRLRDFAAARALIERSLADLERALPADDPEVLATRSNLAFTLHALGDIEGARASFANVLEVQAARLPDDSPDLLRARGNLAGCLAAFPGDEAFERAAHDFVDGARRGLIAQAACSAPREIEAFAARTSGYLALAVECARKRPSLDADVFELLETARNAGLLAADLVARTKGDAAWAAMRARVGDAAADVAKLARATGADGALEAAVRRRDAAMRAMVAAADGAEGGGRAFVRPTARSVGAALPDGSVLVAFWRSRRVSFGPDSAGDEPGDRMLAWVVGGAGAAVRVDLGPIAGITAAAEAWRARFDVAAGRGLAADAGAAISAREGRDAGEALRRLVLDPLLSAVADARRIVVVPDDVLHAIAFDALPLGGGLVGERFRIDVRLEARTMSAPLPPVAQSGLLVAVGDVAFGEATATRQETRAGAFAPLASSGTEARGIAATFDGESVVLAGGAATRDAIASMAPRARILHVATHGWFVPQAAQSARAAADRGGVDALGQRFDARVAAASPMVLCGLALAGANLPPDELGRSPGLITAEEIAGWDLSNCELAVLSACDTNVGLRRAGQGVASLQKALHMAGARSVITSLWKVGDESTKDLMLDFYRRLWVEKKPKRQALWEAKMRIRDAKDETGAPKYTTRDWAAWVLTGDPE